MRTLPLLITALCILLSGCATLKPTPTAAKAKSISPICMGLYHQAGIISAPQLHKQVKVAYMTDPLYPEEALAKKVGGWVRLSFHVDPQGNIHSVKTVQETAPGLAEAAENCLKQWRVEPMVYQGEPVSTVCQASFWFHIVKDPSSTADELEFLREMRKMDWTDPEYNGPLK